MVKIAVTVAEAAERLSLSRSQMYVIVARGDIETVFIGRSRRIPVAALERFVDSLPERTGHAA